ncbi:hypothetical protein [Methylocystis bryophila]|uniref:Uncharacterized protein n=1 Tax=Methylocystis bryophila TaxID=655015 RepID=A0A1W6MZ15_9HYPH|nr:hypothetical protein [Methylocystis bryophila]ARN82786.1 hypothetical protein B1812_18710 [Methylocystis bryophila]BDV39029.1 hypothetical protein DSM21852_22820 [Methylocystis bryophila]
MENWYCDKIVAGPWPFLLLLIPVAGAYFYGRGKRKLAWILIGAWIAIQIPMSFANNFMVNCQGDAPMPGEVAPESEEAPPQGK